MRAKSSAFLRKIFRIQKKDRVYIGGVTRFAQQANRNASDDRSSIFIFENQAIERFDGRTERFKIFVEFHTIP